MRRCATRRSQAGACQCGPGRIRCPSSSPRWQTSCRRRLRTGVPPSSSNSPGWQAALEKRRVSHERRRHAGVDGALLPDGMLRSFLAPIAPLPPADRARSPATLPSLCSRSRHRSTQPRLTLATTKPPQVKMSNRRRDAAAPERRGPVCRRARGAGARRRAGAARQLAALAAGRGDLSAWAARPHRASTITPKYIGNRRLIETAVATLATDRALLAARRAGHGEILGLRASRRRHHRLLAAARAMHRRHRREPDPLRLELCAAARQGPVARGAGRRRR